MPEVKLPTTEELEQLSKAEAAMTPTPWIDEEWTGGEMVLWGPGGGPDSSVGSAQGKNFWDDGNGIVQLRNAAPGLIAACREALRLESELAHHRKLTAAMVRGGEKALEYRGAQQCVFEALTALNDERLASETAIIGLEEKVSSLSHAAASLGVEVIRMKAERAQLAEAWRKKRGTHFGMGVAMVGEGTPLARLLDAIAEEGRGT